jgi:hypothetical protein
VSKMVKEHNKASFTSSGVDLVCQGGLGRWEVAADQAAAVEQAHHTAALCASVAKIAAWVRNSAGNSACIDSCCRSRQWLQEERAVYKAVATDSSSNSWENGSAARGTARATAQPGELHAQQRTGRGDAQRRSTPSSWGCVFASWWRIGGVSAQL